MKVQRIRFPDNTFSWAVLDDNYHLVPPIQSYLRYLTSLERSPNTIHNYACHLKLFWEFLHLSQYDWTTITLQQLADFIRWLRQPNTTLIPLHSPVLAQRTERTINTILAAVHSFYAYQEQIGGVAGLNLYQDQFSPHQPYKPLLHHLDQSKSQKTKRLKLKESRQIPTVLSPIQVQQLVAACQHLRDKLLICLLHETGMRIGQALGLWHQDVRSWDNTIEIVPRAHLANSVRAKCRAPYTVHVSKPLMQLYATYLVEEYPEALDSNYVFVNLWMGQIGQPLHYQTVAALFRRLTQTTGISVHAHLFRHTHATDLIRSGWDLSYVQKRLGHTDIQTTANTYVHLQADDLKTAYQQYLQDKEI